MKQDEVIRHMLRAETGCETRRELDKLGAKDTKLTTVQVTTRTSIGINVPVNLEGDERQAYIEKAVNSFKSKMSKNNKLI
jgi:hypothetical protein